ncbi:MYCBP-associated protein-like [Bicyclus anynana]|uniref:MYCBP-associated protein-like n=1 Tax=Bicyclus anynana TaxID=110368 RepID=A0A6J1NAB8_BICAN|nr:MYCBP-associated protein-like [Bicyclus anynana]
MKKHKLLLCNDSVDPDPELLVWEKWIKIRKEETDHLAYKTGRTTGELAMNLCEKVREKKEEKVVLEHAQVSKKVGVRGTLWVQPERLKQKCYCQPVYEVQRTAVEMGRPKIIQHVGVPKHIQETEKGIAGSQRKTFKKLDLEYVNYKKKREKDLEESIKKIDPHRSTLNELIVIGKKPKPPLVKLSPAPSITFKSNEENTEEALCAVYAVKINDTILFKHSLHQTVDHLENMKADCGKDNCTSWSYYFNCPVSRVGRSELRLQNLGTVTLRYCWKKITRVNADESSTQVFFFNKNENVICPGQSQNVYFTFLSTTPGTYEENWQLVFANICFFDSLENKLTVNLYADSVENLAKIKKKSQKLENLIYANVLTNIARDLLSEIVIKATSVEPQIYPYEKMFLEADIFVMKNPVCFYHQSEVMKLKDMYTEMVPKELWELSFSTWRTAMMSKSFDERMKYYDCLKHSHRECLKPWYEENDVANDKLKAVNQILGQLADKYDKEYQIIEMYNDIRRESRGSTSSQREKLFQCSNISVARNIFYLRVYEHLGTALELCAGVLSSLDLDRWIQFDFCRT